MTFFRPIIFAFHIVCCLQILAGCTAQNQYTEQESNPQQDSVPIQPLHMSSSTEAQHKWQRNNCPRGIPSPTLNLQNPNIVSKNFILLPESGIEKARLYNGDSLEVENTGCEYYVLVYTLKSYKIADNIVQDASYWFGRGADLMLALQDSDVPFDLRHTSQSLKEIADKRNAKLNEEYQLSAQNGLTQKAVLENFGKLQGKGGYMKLRIFIGPL
ncbi:MAG: hypothetical protein ACXWDO_03565 [Bacteroidia bacterium]